MHRNVQQLRGGLVLKAHRLGGSINSRRESNKEEKDPWLCGGSWLPGPIHTMSRLSEKIPLVSRGRANMAHIRQSRPDYGLDRISQGQIMARFWPRPSNSTEPFEWFPLRSEAVPNTVFKTAWGAYQVRDLPPPYLAFMQHLQVSSHTPHPQS